MQQFLLSLHTLPPFFSSPLLPFPPKAILSLHHYTASDPSDAGGSPCDYDGLLKTGLDLAVIGKEGSLRHISQIDRAGGRLSPWGVVPVSVYVHITLPFAPLVCVFSLRCAIVRAWSLFYFGCPN